HRGFGMSVWEIIDESLRKSGYPDAATMHAAGGHDCALPFEKAHFLDGFAFSDGRFRFKPAWSAMGEDGGRMPALPDQIGFAPASADKPFRLVAPPARSFLNSTFTETPSSQAREQRPTVLVHPADCAALGIGGGDLVRLGNERGSVAIHAKPFDGVQR